MDGMVPTRQPFARHPTSFPSHGDHMSDLLLQTGTGGHVRAAQAGKQPDQTHRVSAAAWTLLESHGFKDALAEHQERWLVLFL